MRHRRRVSEKAEIGKKKSGVEQRGRIIETEVDENTVWEDDGER